MQVRELKDHSHAELLEIIELRGAAITLLERDLHEMTAKYEAVGAGGVSLMGAKPVSSDDLRAMNDALCGFAIRWRLNGDWLTCRGCQRNLIASRYDEALNHADGCKRAETAEPKPWQALMEILRPMQAALTQQEQGE